MPDLFVILHEIINTLNDGILAIYEGIDKPFCNQKFMEIWDIPQEYIALENSQKHLELMLDKLQNSHVFLQQLNPSSKQDFLESQSRLVLKNGKILDCKLKIQFCNNKKVSQILVFKDITQKVEKQTDLHQKLKDLISTNKQLKQLIPVDELTQIANRRQFDYYLLQEWQRLAREKKSLSLMLCDIDYFQDYNKTYGQTIGDTCLQEIAALLSFVVQRPADFIARYSTSKFALILPNTGAGGAVHIAENIRKSLWDLKIAHNQSPVSPYITMSIGICSLTPHLNILPDDLLKTTKQALKQAKELGRDRAVFKTLD